MKYLIIFILVLFAQSVEAIEVRKETRTYEVVPVEKYSFSHIELEFILKAHLEKERYETLKGESSIHCSTHYNVGMYEEIDGCTLTITGPPMADLVHDSEK